MLMSHQKLKRFCPNASKMTFLCNGQNLSILLTDVFENASKMATYLKRLLLDKRILLKSSIQNNL